METTNSLLAGYIRENVEDFDLRLKVALRTIDRNRCSLQYADYQLYNEIYDAIVDCIEENELNISPEDIDIEEVIL